MTLNRSRLLNIWQKALDDENTYVIEVAKKAIDNLQNSEELLEAG
ncbi:hypothetical protein [Tolypothrix sp. PCC 7910]|nr:hypothetical protein [Tolypothrix sp. PCC 7910]